MNDDTSVLSAVQALPKLDRMRLIDTLLDTVSTSVEPPFSNK